MQDMIKPKYVIIDQHDACLGYANSMQEATDLVGAGIDFRLITQDEFTEITITKFLAEKVITMTPHQELYDDIQEIISQTVVARVNDANTRALVGYTLGSYLTDMDISNYYVICDDRNNTPETIDDNSLIVDVMFSYPWISLNVVLSVADEAKAEPEPEADYFTITRAIANGL
jgi:alpha-acetolactate decarboxylase